MKNEENSQTMDDLQIIKENYGEEMAKFCELNFADILKTEGLLSEMFLTTFYPDTSLLENIIKTEKKDDFVDFIFYQYKMMNIVYNYLEKARVAIIDNIKENYFWYEALLPQFHRLWKYVNSLEGAPKPLLISNHIRAKDGKYYKYNCAGWDCHYYCPDNIILQSLNPIQLDKSRYIVLDYFILDLQDKKMMRLNYRNHDYSFLDSNGEYRKFYPLYKNSVGKYQRYFPPSPKLSGHPSFIDERIHDMLAVYKDGDTSVVFSIELDFEYDSFIESIGQIKEVEVIEEKENRIIKIYNDDNSDSISASPIIIRLDKDNNIVGYINNNIKKIGDDFLAASVKLEEIEALQVETIGNNCLRYNNDVKKISFPKVRDIGESFFEYNQIIEEVDLQQVEKLGANSLKNGNFDTIDFSRLNEIGDKCFQKALRVKKINLPSVSRIGNNVLEYNENFKTELPYLPALRDLGERFLHKSINEDSRCQADRTTVYEKVKRL